MFKYLPAQAARLIYCGHWRRKGGKGVKAPWILKISAKKGCFLNFEWEKPNFTTFGLPRKNPLVPPSWKKSFRRPWLRLTSTSFEKFLRMVVSRKAKGDSTSGALVSLNTRRTPSEFFGGRRERSLNMKRWGTWNWQRGCVHF